MKMKISEVVETSNECIEVNDNNKEECKRCESRVDQAQRNVNNAQQNLSSARAAYSRAITARNNAKVKASNEETSDGSDLEHYDQMVNEAMKMVENCQARLANEQYLEQLAQQELSVARQKLRDSTRELEGLSVQLGNLEESYYANFEIASSASGLMYGEDMDSLLSHFESQGALASSTKERVLLSLGKSGGSEFLRRTSVSGPGTRTESSVKKSNSVDSSNNGIFDTIGSSESYGAYSQGVTTVGKNDSFTGSSANTNLSPLQALSQYMNSHNYGRSDYSVYSKDPEWQRLHKKAFPDYYKTDISSVYSSLEIGNFGHLTAQKSEIIDDTYTFTGSGYEAYLETYQGYGKSYTIDRSEYKKSKITTVDPSLIEGISVSQYEFDNPNVFWGQHEKQGTEKTFLEIASHIPEVKSELESGTDLYDLMQDERLGKTASIYFDTSRADFPTVIEGNGFYTFESNGRHRILAARLLGYDIPVRVIGKYKHV